MSEPIRVFVVMWDCDDGLNCDLYRNVPALVSEWPALSVSVRAAAEQAMASPGEAVPFESVSGGVLRYCTVSDI